MLSIFWAKWLALTVFENIALAIRVAKIETRLFEISAIWPRADSVSKFLRAGPTWSKNFSGPKILPRWADSQKTSVT